MSNARKLADNLPMTGATGSRNLIINGNMKIAQRGTSSTTTNGFGTVDRFRIWHGAVGNVTTNQNSGGANAVDGVSNYSFRATATNTASLIAGSDAHIRYVVEDKDIENIGITNPNNNFTLSFYVKCSNAGQSSIGITSGNFSSATYVVPFTIASADTWQRVELTFPGNAALSNVSSGFGLRIYWDLGIGTTYQTSTHNQWITSGNPFAAAGNLQIIGVYDRWLQITGVQLEVGSKATPFEHEPTGVTLSKCQRYYYNFQSAGTTTGNEVGIVCAPYGSNNFFGQVTFPATMRATPTLLSGGAWATRANNNNDITSTISYQRSSPRAVLISGTATSVPNGQAHWLEPSAANNPNTAYMNFDAEL